MPCYPFLGEGSPTKIDYRKKGALSLTYLLADLDVVESSDLNFLVETGWVSHWTQNKLHFLQRGRFSNQE